MAKKNCGAQRVDFPLTSSCLVSSGIERKLPHTAQSGDPKIIIRPPSEKRK